jgi:hypothetical protein
MLEFRYITYVLHSIFMNTERASSIFRQRRNMEELGNKNEAYETSKRSKIVTS